MLNCQNVTKLLSEAQERKLLISEKMSLKLHLMMCSGCNHFAQQMPTLRSMARAYTKGKHESKDSKPE